MKRGPSRRLRRCVARRVPAWAAARRRGEGSPPRATGSPSAGRRSGAPRRHSHSKKQGVPKSRRRSPGSRGEALPGSPRDERQHDDHPEERPDVTGRDAVAGDLARSCSRPRHPEGARCKRHTRTGTRCWRRRRMPAPGPPGPARRRARCRRRRRERTEPEIGACLSCPRDARGAEPRAPRSASRSRTSGRISRSRGARGSRCRAGSAARACSSRSSSRRARRGSRRRRFLFRRAPSGDPVRRRRALRGPHQEDQDDSGDEAADVSPPRHAARGSARGRERR